MSFLFALFLLLILLGGKGRGERAAA